MKSALSWANLDISAGVVRNVWCWLWSGCDAGPLSSIVWANLLASGWFVHCYFLNCYFFSYLPTVSFFFLPLYSYCYSNELLLSFLLLFFHLKLTVSFIPTCPLLLSFLLLFFLLLFFLPETVTFFPVTFFPVTFFPCTTTGMVRSPPHYQDVCHQWQKFTSFIWANCIIKGGGHFTTGVVRRPPHFQDIKFVNHDRNSHRLYEQFA